MQQKKIRKTNFAVIGLGGVGGFALENLVRIGVERLIIFDHDRIDYSNFNRQILANEDALDKNKKDVALERIRSINKKIKVSTFSEFDASKILDAEIIIDATDNIKTKLAVASACRKMKIPYVFSSAQDSRGIVSVFTSYNFAKAFQVDDAKLKTKYCTSIICPAAAIAGSLASSMAINCILKKPFVKAPEALFFDLFDKRIFWKGELG
jgi:molybdopterin/thiamine biosynthesis adenylyltransferase